MQREPIAAFAVGGPHTFQCSPQVFLKPPQLPLAPFASIVTKGVLLPRTALRKSVFLFCLLIPSACVSGLSFDLLRPADAHAIIRFPINVFP